MKRKLFILIICTMLIALWAYAALDKTVSFQQFAAQLKLQPLPQWSLTPIQWGLPVVEFCAALLICFPNTRLKGLILSAILMTCFTLYVLFALTGAFGRIPCSCAGLISALGWRGHLVFNLIFMILSFCGIYLQYHRDDNFVRHQPITI